MDTLTSMQVFCNIVEQGSFTKASEKLGISLAMTSKHLKHLEQHLQAKLLNRNNRRQSLTDVGERYYLECRHALDTLATAKAQAQHATDSPQGKLRVIAPIWFATPLFVAALAKFQRQFPNIQLSVNLDNRFTNLVADGYDIALRVTTQPHDQLIARPLSKIRFECVASPSFIAQYGKPATKDDLNRFNCVVPNYVERVIPGTIVADSNNTLMLAEMTKAGMGLAILPHWLIQTDLTSGTLVQVFDHPMNELTLHAVYVNRQFLSSKVRSFIDFLVAELK